MTRGLSKSVRRSARKLRAVAVLALMGLGSFWFAIPRFASAADGVVDVSNIVTWATRIAYSLAGLVIIIGGLRYSAAAGNSSEAEGGKTMIKEALIGLAIAILANVLITYFRR